jgi:hypothetical protein
MELHETLMKAEKALCKGIDEISSRGDLNPSDLKMLGDAADALKDITEVKSKSSGSYERYMDDGYGRRARDSRGRYMDDGYSADYGYERYNADNYRADSYGHSDAEEKEFIRWKMNNAKNEQEREKYRRKLEQM